MAEPLTLFLVCYQDEDSNTGDMFVTATNPLEAFALWRADQGIDHADYEADTSGDREVGVHAVPTVSNKPEVHAWSDGALEVFNMSMNTLATQAIEQAMKSTTVEEG